MAPFGKVLPVIGLNLGFLGQMSRTGERVITARQLLSTTASPVLFGDPVVIIPDSTGGTYQGVPDFITGGGVLTPDLFAGVANREVKTQLVFPLTPGSAQVGQYNPGDMLEAGERGSIVVGCLVGTPVAEAPVYIRTALNGAFPAGVVGGFEAAADGAFVSAAVAGNTGNGTVTGAAAGGSASIGGAYSVTFTDATHFTVTDPNGRIVGKGTTGVAFTSTGVNFTITAGGTPFVKGDAFTMTATMKTVNLGGVGVVFRTGVLDANNAVEITMKQRVAA